MNDDPRLPVRPAAVHFDAPTYEPLAVAVLITQDPTDGRYKAYIRPGRDFAPPDPHLIALLVQSCEIRNLPERDHQP